MRGVEQPDFQARLQRLWKGALVVLISAGYLVVIALHLVLHGWQAALVALLVIAVGLLLRYIGNDVDRIGWQLGQDGTADAKTTRRQQRMYHTLAALTQVPNVALVVHGHLLGGWWWAAGLAGGLLGIEMLYTRIRKVNRAVAFAQASYGFAELGPHHGPQRLGALRETKERELERKLDTLERMAAEGLISRKAYKKARDKLRVRFVMETHAADSKPPPAPRAPP